MEIYFKKLSELDGTKKQQALLEIKEIFFLSTSKTHFDSPEHRELFFEKWCGDYLTHFEFLVFLAMNEQGEILGYLTGCLNTNEGLKVLRVPGISVFSDLYEMYPAHLHINFHPRARGMGVGSRLVLSYMEYLEKKHIDGVHLITSPDAQNVSFYERLGFNVREERLHNQYALLFLGRKI